jgi:hypothetical protein
VALRELAIFWPLLLYAAWPASPGRLAGAARRG